MRGSSPGRETRLKFYALQMTYADVGISNSEGGWRFGESVSFHCGCTTHTSAGGPEGQRCSSSIASPEHCCSAYQVTGSAGNPHSGLHFGLKDSTTALGYHVLGWVIHVPTMSECMRTSSACHAMPCHPVDLHTWG